MSKCIIVNAPKPIHLDKHDVRIFLAGSIDNGSAEPWVKRMVGLFENRSVGTNTVQFLNPRREQWDATLRPELDNPVFIEQIDWELTGIMGSDMVLFYFAPGSISPVTMLECGIAAAHPKLNGSVYVCCPNGFWRKGNVEYTCRYFGVPVFDDMERMVDVVSSKIRTRMGKSAISRNVAEFSGF